MCLYKILYACVLIIYLLHQLSLHNDSNLLAIYPSLSVCLSVCMYVCLSPSFSPFLSFSYSLSLSPSLFLSLPPSLSLLLSLYLCLSACPPLSLSAPLTLLSVSFFIHARMYLSVCLTISLHFHGCDFLVMNFDY